MGHEIPSCDGVLDIHEEPDPEELEDAYLRYASSKVKTGTHKWQCLPRHRNKGTLFIR